MEKVYKMPGYDLHLIPTNKFKNIIISLKLQNTLDEKTVAKRTLLSFMLTTGTEKYPSTQELSIYLESMYGMKLGANVVTKGKSHIININSICINQEYLPYKEDLIQRQIQLLNDIFFKPNASKTVFDQTMFERKKKELVERLINNQDDKFYYSLEKMFEYMGKGTCLGISSHGNIEDIKKIENEELFSYFKECIKNDQKHIYVVGNVDESIVHVFENCLSFEKNNSIFEREYGDVNDWETMMFLYHAALKQVATKIDILNDEFQYIQHYNPIEHVKSRIKTPESIVKKLKKDGYESNIPNMIRYVNDIAGIRIICSFTSDIYLIADFIRKQNDLRIENIKDYMKQPKESGYQSYHLLVSVPVYLYDKILYVPVEVQIRTIAQDFWASLEHKIYYKFEGNAPDYISKDLQECATIVAQLDQRMLSLNEAIQKYSATENE